LKLHQGCIAAAILLFFILSGAFLNARYLDHTVTYIKDELSDLPDDADFAEEKILNVQAFWEERRKVLSFTLSETSLDGISLLFDEILIAVNNSDDEEYQKATARLMRAVESINQLEKISLSNIF
jgi:hypothetical protein